MNKRQRKKWTKKCSLSISDFIRRWLRRGSVLEQILIETPVEDENK